MKSIFRSLLILIMFLILVLTIFYYPTIIYNFPESKPFHGEYIFNPYEHIPNQEFRVNLHAHSIAWKGITNGQNSEEEIFSAYKQRGYDLAAISNYHNISRFGETQEGLYIPVYEHGYNVGKSHYLSINPDGVNFFDFPLFQNSSHQQKIINLLREENAYIAIAHPKFGGGRSMKNMRELTGYHFTEILNHYRNSSKHYDAALSSGRLSWVMSNDDTHNIHKEPTFKRWNMIFADTLEAKALLESYASGKNYAVLNKEESFLKKFISCQRLADDQFRVTFSSAFDSLLVIGEHGTLKDFAISSDTITFRFKENYPYLRIVAKDKNTEIYLNPLVRYNGVNIPLNANLRADENLLLTWLFRLGLFISSLVILFVIKKIIKR